MGLAAAAVVVILLLALGVPALLRAMNPAVYLFDSLVNTGTTLAQEQETLQKNLGLNRAIEQSVITQSVRLEELPVDGPEADMLKGLQFTVRSQGDLEARRSWFTYTLDMGDFTVLLMDVWLDDEMIAFASPQLTTGRWYGTLNEGFGAPDQPAAGQRSPGPGDGSGPLCRQLQLAGDRQAAGPCHHRRDVGSHPHPAGRGWRSTGKRA